MTVFAMLLQGPTPTSAWDMIFGGTLPTKIVLLILLAASVASWILIFWKIRQFREVRQQGDAFLEALHGVLKPGSTEGA